jgi:hypothetical protein
MPARAANESRPATPSTPAPAASAGLFERRARLAAFWLLLVVAVVFSVTHMDQGVDTWISLAGGRDIAAHGVRLDDPFSFNSRPPEPPGKEPSQLRRWLHPDGWINQNWLTHVWLHAIERGGGRDALVYWKLLNYLLVAATLVAAGRVLGASTAASLVAAAAALAVSRDHLSMRAQDVSNLLTAALILIVALARARGHRWLWALVPLFAVWANAHGGFIFGLVLLALLVAGEWFARGQRERPGEARGRNPRAATVTALAALAATVVLSPYRLANITHPLMITLGGDAPLWRVVHEWRPLFSTPLASPVPFTVFAAVTLACAVLAALQRGESPVRPRHVGYYGLLVAGAFALAVASARFVPLAAITAAPFLAFWIDTALAGRARSLDGRPARLIVTAALGIAALGAAAALATRAAATYVAPWPQDFAHRGLFDRMTHAHQRPWGACAFLTANGVRGRVWNFWDEGGFIAACQQPDAATGAPPVQVFIDGRAQAAFDVAALRSYLDLLNGPGRTDALGASGVSGERVDDLETLRQWTVRRLRDLDVWLALVPAGRQRTAIARAVAGLPGWQLAYVDGDHTLFVDGSHTDGEELLAAVAGGSARYPDEASAALTGAMRLLPPRSDGDRQRAGELARTSYRARSGSLAVLCAVRAAGAGPARSSALAFCREVGEEFAANRDRHRAAAGYGQRLDAAVVAFEYLAVEARKDGQAELGRWASSWLVAGRAEQTQIVERVLW